MEYLFIPMGALIGYFINFFIHKVVYEEYVKVFHWHSIVYIILGASLPFFIIQADKNLQEKAKLILENREAVCKYGSKYYSTYQVVKVVDIKKGKVYTDTNTIFNLHYCEPK